MRHPGPRVVVDALAVMDGSQMIIRIGVLDDLEKAIPILRFFLLHEIKFVGDGPPDISIGCQASDDVSDIAFIAGGIHAIENPMYFDVGKKKDDIRFDDEVAELTQEHLQVLEELR